VVALQLGCYHPGAPPLYSFTARYPTGQQVVTKVYDAGEGHSTLTIHCTGSTKQADDALCATIAACLERDTITACLDRSGFLEGRRFQGAP
jgi:hypothetical protein